MKENPRSSRVLELDVLRGFALFGILFGNLTWFTGYAVLGSDQRSELATPGLDSVMTWMIHFAVDGKFYGIFSMLFGVSFALLARRSGAFGSESRLLVRRFSWLFLLGLAHALFVWFGDIVSLYAVFAIPLFLFVRLSSEGLLVWAVAMFAVPSLLSAAWLAFPSGDVGYGPSELLPTFGHGSYGEIFVANWGFLKERWFLALYGGRPFKLLGLFLLGLWAARSGVALEPGKRVETLRRLRAWGLGLGIPANVALAVLVTLVPDRPPSLLGWVRATVDSIAVPSLAVGYSAILFLGMQSKFGSRALSWLAAPGRMTLTNYFAQSLVGVVLFYGYGAGLWGTVGASWIGPLAVAIFAVQTVVSRTWLKFFPQGPLEWLWRVGSYGRVKTRVGSRSCTGEDRRFSAESGS